MKSKIASGLSFAALFPGIAQADTLLSNMATSPPPHIGYIHEVSSQRGAAIGFRTPPGVAFSLEAVTLTLRPEDETEPFTPRIELRAEGEGGPTGPTLLTFDTTGLVVVPDTARYTLRPATPLLLQAGTTYWLVMPRVTSLAESRFDWYSEFESPELEITPPAGLATLVGYRYISSRTAGGWQTSSYASAISLSGTARPQLAVAPGAAGLVISWPAVAGGFALEGTGSLSPPQSWEPVPGAVVEVDGRFSVVVEPVSPQRFFRLRRSE